MVSKVRVSGLLPETYIPSHTRIMLFSALGTDNGISTKLLLIPYYLLPSIYCHQTSCPFYSAPLGCDLLYHRADCIRPYLLRPITKINTFAYFKNLWIVFETFHILHSSMECLVRIENSDRWKVQYWKKKSKLKIFTAPFHISFGCRYSFSWILHVLWKIYFILIPLKVKYRNKEERKIFQMASFLNIKYRQQTWSTEE